MDRQNVIVEACFGLRIAHGFFSNRTPVRTYIGNGRSIVIGSWYDPSSVASANTTSRHWLQVFSAWSGRWTSNPKSRVQFPPCSLAGFLTR